MDSLESRNDLDRWENIGLTQSPVDCFSTLRPLIETIKDRRQKLTVFYDGADVLNQPKVQFTRDYTG